MNTISALMRENIKHLVPYINDNVTDIHINRPQEVFVKYNDATIEKIYDPNLTFDWLYGMCRLMANISGQEFDENTQPMVGYKLPGGHRVQVVAGSLTPSGLAIAIRVNAKRDLTLADFNMNESAAMQLRQLISARKTILISGGTGSGKTSLVNCLIPLIPLNNRIITIEDVSELIVPHENHTSLLYSANNSGNVKLTANDLFNATLRLDPDRIIIGEIRQMNAITFFHAINSGHDGSLATIHASSPEEALNKICDYMILDGKIASGAADAALLRLKQYIGLVVQITNENGMRKLELQHF